MTFTPGTLVVYEGDTRYVAAFSLYAVVGAAEPDGNGRPQVAIQCVNDAPPFSPIGSMWKVFPVPVSTLTPIAAFGYRIATLNRITFANGHETFLLRLEFDRALPVTTDRKWGQISTFRDDKGTEIRTEPLYDLIRKAWLEAYVDTRTKVA